MKKLQNALRIIFITILLLCIAYVFLTANELKKFIDLYGANLDSIIAQQNFKLYVTEFARGIFIGLAVLGAAFVLVEISFEKRLKKSTTITYCILLLFNILNSIFMGFLSITQLITLSIILLSIITAFYILLIFFSKKSNGSIFFKPAKIKDESSESNTSENLIL